MKITDLAQLDLAYAPPFSPAKDPVIVSSYVTENILNGRTEQMSVEELETFMRAHCKEDYVLIDARTVEEYEKGTIPNAVNFPLDALRNHTETIKQQGKKVIVFCQKGLRGYLAELILRNNGMANVANVAGGFKIWQMYSNHIEMPQQKLLKNQI